MEKNILSSLKRTLTMMENTFNKKKDFYLPNINSELCYMLDNIDSINIGHEILKLVDERYAKSSDFYKKACIERQTFQKLNNQDYIPSKDTMFCYILALELPKDEAVKLLSMAGFSFKYFCKRDVSILFFIEKKIYDINDINIYLENIDEPILGNAKK